MQEQLEEQDTETEFTQELEISFSGVEVVVSPSPASLGSEYHVTWDILTGGNNVVELARVLTRTFPGNSITIIQPYMQKELLVLQETNIDRMGAFLVYAPIELPKVTSIVKGGDATKVPILPLGIIISPDGRLSSDRDSTANAQNGSILIVAFQILICGHNNSTSQQQQMERGQSSSGCACKEGYRVNIPCIYLLFHLSEFSAILQRRL
ncbi:homeobox-leucine zipper protein HDG12-like [Solanum stenotomum]|uniref:homeobox-leucine zipper protein HDG12-like n=1 Tax=Solanum stenotomum TaxID=172797 RepID=UPI0020D184E7|nr:homeobox-leucine zipper protein HDG12-like [Solanum stenotomum]